MPEAILVEPEEVLAPLVPSPHPFVPAREPCRESASRANSPPGSAATRRAANVPLGASVGATPDGRRAGEPIAEGVSPVHGCDTGGPTKVLRSLSRLPTIKSIAQLLNLRLSPGSLESEEGLNRLVALLKGFRSLKLWHVQFNTVSTEALLEAQKHPEKYRDLVVRVAGYSALFVTLDRATQDDIIRRTSYNLN